MSLLNAAIEQMLAKQAAEIGVVGQYVNRAREIVNTAPDEKHQELLDDLLCEAANTLRNREYARLLIALGVGRPVDIYIQLIATVKREEELGFLTNEEALAEVDSLSYDAVAILSDADKQEMFVSLSNIHKEPH